MKKVWKQTTAKGAGLHEIGAPLRSIRPPAHHQCSPLPGSLKGPTKKWDKPAYEPKVTIVPPLRYDPRYQCAPGVNVYGAGFALAGPGRDIETGKGWK